MYVFLNFSSMLPLLGE